MITRILHATEELVPGKPAVEAKKAVIVAGKETEPAVAAVAATEDELVVTSASIQTFDEKGAEKCCEELDPKQFAGIFAASAKAAEKTAAEAEKAEAVGEPVPDSKVPVQGQLPPDFPGSGALSTYGVHTYAQARKLVAGGSDWYEKVPNVGKETAIKIEEALTATIPA